MRLLYVATSYPSNETDWRGLFIRHLAFALAERDEITLEMWTPPGPLPPDAVAVTTPRETAWLEGLMTDGGIAKAIRAGNIQSILKPFQLLHFLHKLYRRQRQVDLYHLNWLQTAIPLPTGGAPALMTVLGTDLKILTLPLVKTLLRRTMRQRPVTICPNAEWMAEPLKNAFGDLAQIQPVPFGIDPVWYAIERNPAPKKPRWLAVTRLTRDKLGDLLKWSAPLFEGQNRELHLLGPMQEDIALPPWIHYHGPASPEELSRKWFPSAHGLITLSRHAEGRPQVMLEAMAAGLPIIASDMPAHAGLVRNGITGVLCGTQEQYGKAVYELEDWAMNNQLGEEARRWVRSEIGTWRDCAQRYANLYRRLLAVGNG